MANAQQLVLDYLQQQGIDTAIASGYTADILTILRTQGLLQEASSFSTAQQLTAKLNRDANIADRILQHAEELTMAFGYVQSHLTRQIFLREVGCSNLIDELDMSGSAKDFFSRFVYAISPSQYNQVAILWKLFRKLKQDCRNCGHIQNIQWCIDVLDAPAK